VANGVTIDQNRRHLFFRRARPRLNTQVTLGCTTRQRRVCQCLPGVSLEWHPPTVLTIRRPLKGISHIRRKPSARQAKIEPDQELLKRAILPGARLPSCAACGGTPAGRGPRRRAQAVSDPTKNQHVSVAV
jgi:hypothetical protein